MFKREIKNVLPEIYIYRSNSNDITIYATDKEPFHLRRSIHEFHPGILINKLHYFIKYFLIFFANY